MYLLSPDHRQHVLDLTHDTFAAIKTAQGILVDFAGFPAKMIDLLERCLAAPAAPPRFQAVLRDDLFQIVEVNDFKHVPHICLQLTPSSDAGCKELLTFRLAEVQHQCEQLAEQLGVAREQHDDVYATMQALQEELALVKRDAAEEHNAVRCRAAAALEAAHAEHQQAAQLAQSTQTTLQQALDEACAARVSQQATIQELQQALSAAETRGDAAVAEASALRDALQRQSAANQLLATQLQEAAAKREAAAVLGAQCEQQLVQIKELQKQVEGSTQEAQGCRVLTMQRLCTYSACRMSWARHRASCRC